MGYIQASLSLPFKHNTFTAIISCRPHTSACSRLRVHSTVRRHNYNRFSLVFFPPAHQVTFNSLYTLTFIISLAAAIIIRVFSSLFGAVLLILFFFFGLPFILFYSAASKLAPSHPRVILFLTLAAFASAAA
jgi:hypothetical protein